MTDPTRWREVKAQQTAALGRYVKRLREERNYTMRQLARRAGISHSHVSLLEKGERTPSPHILRQLAPPLRVSAEDLLRVAGYLSEIPGKEPSTPDQEALTLLRSIDRRLTRIEKDLEAHTDNATDDATPNGVTRPRRRRR